MRQDNLRLPTTAWALGVSDGNPLERLDRDIVLNLRIVLLIGIAVSQTAESWAIYLSARSEQFPRERVRLRNPIKRQADPLRIAPVTPEHAV